MQNALLRVKCACSRIPPNKLYTIRCQAHDCSVRFLLGSAAWRLCSTFSSRGLVLVLYDFRVQYIGGMHCSRPCCCRAGPLVQDPLQSSAFSCSPRFLTCLTPPDPPQLTSRCRRAAPTLRTCCSWRRSRPMRRPSLPSRAAWCGVGAL